MGDWCIEQPTLGIAMRSEDRGSSPPHLDTFEEAERLVLLNLAFLAEPPTVDPANPKRWLYDYLAGNVGLRTSLDLGERALPEGTDPTHFVRLHLIRRIMFGEAATLPDSAIAPPHEQVERPVWAQIGNTWHAATRFGEAVIVEDRELAYPRYTTRIEHPNGAVFPCGLGRDPDGFSSFEEAEAYIDWQLDALADPPQLALESFGEAQPYYPCLEFTIDICAKTLPTDTDPIHIERLDHLKTDLFLKVE